jgi:hypothetical protein
MKVHERSIALEAKRYCSELLIEEDNAFYPEDLGKNSFFSFRIF